MSKGFLTVKEFAEQANISQQAVYKQINNRLKPFIHTVNGQKFIEAIALEKFYSTQVAQPLNTDSTSEKREFQPEVEQPNSTFIQPQNERNVEHELEDQIKELQNELKKIIENQQEEKQFLREQIKQKDKQIESLTENLKMAQQLAAADKKKVMELEAKQVEKENEIIAAAADHEIDQTEKEILPEKKKSFFSRIFDW